ncbi:MAG: hypothetical protein AAB383_06455 [Patescibacteria group bacterium]
MKFRKLYLWILLAVFVVSAVISYLYWKDFEPRNKVLVFVTVGIDQTERPDETSSYELQRASEHFSDVILGWTLEPSFRQDFLKEAGADFTGQRQEKQNLLFEITDAEENISEGDVSAGESFLKVLNAQLAEYEAATHQGYVLAVQNLSYELGQKSPLPMVGDVLLALVLVGVLLLAYEYAQTRRRS